MIKVTLKDDDGRVIQTIEYPVEMVLPKAETQKPKSDNKSTVAGVAGKLLKNLILNNVKDYFGGLL